jgi:hypothetical protein
LEFKFPKDEVVFSDKEREFDLEDAAGKIALARKSATQH